MSRPLRIGVDARELLGAPTGVGRYLGELLGRWTARPDASRRQFVLYVPEPLLTPFGPAAEVQVVGRGRGTLWEQTHLRRAIARDRPDVFFAPAYTAPLGLSVPLALTIHDVSFAAHPEWFRPREGMRRRFVTRRSAARARVVFTDSEFSRGEIETRLGVPPERIQVIPPGVTIRRPPARPREPLVLFVGSLFNRRRLPDLIEAFARATADLPESRLEIVGDDRTWPKQDLPAIARRFGVAARTGVSPYVPDGVLTDLYGRASVFVFLSEYEGFGLTPLEALAAGVPVIVLDTPVAREVYGEAAWYVGRGAIEETARAIRAALTDPGFGAPLLARAPDVLARYSWDRAADATLGAIERIANR